MGKLTHQQVKMHDEALALLSLGRTLTYEERLFVFEHYNPMATQNVTKNAIFFTPVGLAWEVATMGHCGGKARYLDACAGIGVLAYQMMVHEDKRVKEMVCVELCDEFVQVGRKLVPEATWIRGDIFDRDLIESIGTFDSTLSNPPFSRTASRSAGSWLAFRGVAHLMVAEVALRISRHGATMIIPEMDQESHRNGREEDSRNLARFKKLFPGVHLSVTASDASAYADQWQGANPNVELVDLDGSELPLPLPLGLGKLDLERVARQAQADTDAETEPAEVEPEATSESLPLAIVPVRQVAPEPAEAIPLPSAVNLQQLGMLDLFGMK